MTPLGRALVASLGWCAIPGVLAAQAGPGIEFSAVGSAVRVRGASPVGGGVLRGVALGGEGALAVGSVVLRGGYSEGMLHSDLSGTAGRRQVNGFALLGVRLFSHIELAAGPQARAYLSPGARDERWIFWQLRARYDGAVAGPRVRGFAEAWHAASGSVSVPDPLAAARGGAAGLVVKLTGPLAVRFIYSIDEARRGAGGGETVEALTVAIGYGHR